MELVYGAILVWMGWLYIVNQIEYRKASRRLAAIVDRMNGYVPMTDTPDQSAKIDKYRKMYRDIDLKITGGSLPICPIFPSEDETPSKPRSSGIITY